MNMNAIIDYLNNAIDRARAAEAEVLVLRGALAAQDERDLAATNRLGMPPAGCDTSDTLAHEVLELRARVSELEALEEPWKRGYQNARARAEAAEAEAERLRAHAAATGADLYAAREQRLALLDSLLAAMGLDETRVDIEDMEDVAFATVAALRARIAELEARVAAAVAERDDANIEVALEQEHARAGWQRVRELEAALARQTFVTDRLPSDGELVEVWLFAWWEPGIVPAAQGRWRNSRYETLAGVQGWRPWPQEASTEQEPSS